MRSVNEINEFRVSWCEFMKVIEKNQELPFYYRGQPDAEYKLKSTLSRCLPNKLTYCAQEYHENLLKIIKEYPNKNSFLNLPQDFNIGGNFMSPIDPAGIRDYEQENNITFMAMIYFRHRGIPSPLLDWTKDPWIASYFSCNDIIKHDKDAAIFVLKKLDDNCSGGYRATKSRMHLIDPEDHLNNCFQQNISKSEYFLQRHNAQKSAYMLCFSNKNDLIKIQYEDINESLVIKNHNNNVFKIDKYVIPFQDKKSMLAYLIEQKSITNERLYCEFSYEDLAIKHLYF